MEDRYHTCGELMTRRSAYAELPSSIEIDEEVYCTRDGTWLHHRLVGLWDDQDDSYKRIEACPYCGKPLKGRR